MWLKKALIEPPILEERKNYCTNCSGYHFISPSRCNYAICSICHVYGHDRTICSKRKVISHPCQWCRKPGHLFIDCPNRCSSCTEVHSIKRCPERLARKKCFCCGELGHLSRTCPQIQLHRCSICHWYGHIPRSCPNRCRLCTHMIHMKHDVNQIQVKPHVWSMCRAKNRFKWAGLHFEPQITDQCHLCHKQNVPYVLMVEDLADIDIDSNSVTICMTCDFLYDDPSKRPLFRINQDFSVTTLG